MIEQLEEAGIESATLRNSIRLRLSPKDVDSHRELLADIIQKAEEWSRR